MSLTDGQYDAVALSSFERNHSAPGRACGACSGMQGSIRTPWRSGRWRAVTQILLASCWRSLPVIVGGLRLG